MSALQIVPREKPASIVKLAQPRLNKQDHIEDYIKQLRTCEYDVIEAEITETIQLDSKDWNEFVTHLLADRSWLSGKGGWNSWTMPDADYFKLNETERAEYKRGTYSLYIAVIAPTGTTIYVDPEGYGYARYVAFNLSGLKPEKTREQLAREREAVETAANPPVVHQSLSRDETIAEIRSALKRRSGRAWSVTGGRGTAWGWIDIGVLPREHKLPEEQQIALYAQLHELLGTNSFKIPSGSDYYQEYIDRANGRKPSVYGTPYWD